MTNYTLGERWMKRGNGLGDRVPRFNIFGFQKGEKK